MRCAVCGAEFRPSGHGKPQKYCSARCRNKAKGDMRKARRNGTASPSPPKPPEPPEPAKTTDVGVGPPDLTLADFHLMMDGSVVDVCRHNMAILQKRLEKPDISDNAMAALSKEIRELAKEIERRDGAADDLLAGLHGAPAGAETGAKTGAGTEAAHGGWQEAI